MKCDICSRDVRTLAATARGARGLDLCSTCYRRILRQEQAQRQARSLPDPAAGPPYEWPRCELCGDDVDSHGLGRYTVNGTRRRFCSVECRALRNARVSAPLRAAALRKRVHSGLWVNPQDYTTPEQRAEWGARGGEVRAAQIRAEIEQGTWVSPSSTPAGRAKLRRPRKHAADPLLHSALQKLTAGACSADLSEAERDAHRRYRRRLEAARGEQRSQRSREAYRRAVADPGRRAALRARFARQGARLRSRPANPAFWLARQAAGYTIASLAAALGVHCETVRLWESHSVVPRDPDLRQRVAALLSTWPWPLPPDP